MLSYGSLADRSSSRAERIGEMLEVTKPCLAVDALRIWLQNP